MKLQIMLAAATLAGAFASQASADQYVHGYFRGSGTYVQPYMRSDADGNPFNNYSTRGNINPYTGKMGTHNPYGYNPSPTYESPLASPRSPLGFGNPLTPGW